MTRARLWLGIGMGTLGASAVGCSIFVSLDGYVGEADASDDGTGVDGSVHGDASDAQVLDGPDGASLDSSSDATDCGCLPAAPPGWSIVAFIPDASAQCPSGYAGVGDAGVLVDPAVGPASCSCACQVSAPPSCENGTIESSGDNSGTCSTAAPAVQGNGGACTAVSGKELELYNSVTPLGASGGTCTPKVTANVPKGGATGSACVVSAGPSCGGTCAPAVGPPFTACVEAADASVCPPGYSQPHVVGTALTDTRGCNANCTCHPEPTATCSNAQFNWYSDGQCSSLLGSAVANGSCVQTGSGSSLDVGSYKYSASTTSADCGAPTAQPTPDGGASLVGARLVCCP